MRVPTALTDQMTEVVETAGYGGVAGVIAAENLFPPIPSEAVLPLAGFVAGRGDASIVGMLVASTIGSLVGAWILYGLAAWIGPERLHRFVARHGRWFRLKVSDLERAEAWFDRRASMAVLVGRCVPLVRSIVSIPAGFRRMPFVRFTLLTLVGSLAWNGTLVLAGALLGDRWHQVGDVVGNMQLVVAAALVGVAALVAWRRLRPSSRPTGV